MTERRRILWFILPVSIVLAGAVHLMTGSSARSAAERNAQEPQGTSRTPDEQRFATLEREVQRLRVALQASQRDSNADRGAPAAVASTGDGEPQEEDRLDDADERRPREPELAEAELRETRIRFWDAMSDQVDTEEIDPAWRNTTEPVLEQAIPRLGPQVSIAETSCASTLCRVKLNHPEWPHIPNERFSDFVMNREGPLASMEIRLDIRDEGNTTLYFVREEPAQEQ